MMRDCCVTPMTPCNFSLLYVCNSCDGYRSGLLRAARRASAMAGTKVCLCGSYINGHLVKQGGNVCPKHALLSLAAKYREEAGE